MMMEPWGSLELVTTVLLWAKYWIPLIPSLCRPWGKKLILRHTSVPWRLPGCTGLWRTLRVSPCWTRRESARCPPRPSWRESWAAGRTWWWSGCRRHLRTLGGTRRQGPSVRTSSQYTEGCSSVRTLGTPRSGLRQRHQRSGWSYHFLIFITVERGILRTWGRKCRPCV